MDNKFSIEYLSRLNDVLAAFPHERFEEIGQALLTAYHKEKQVFIMGNGGSGSTASHFVCDINKGCCLPLEKKFKVMCLNDNIPSILAYANDLSYDKIFIEPIKNFLKRGDLVIGISGSGNSENVLQAVEYGNTKNAKTIGLSGFDGGKLAQIADIPFVVKIHDMQKVEDVHMIVVHMLMQYLCRALNIQG